MKPRFFFVTLATAAAFILAGCGKKDSSSDASPGATQQATAAGPHAVEVTAGDTMKFSLTTIEAKAGEELKITLTNVGTQPKEVMGHNFIILKPGTDVAAFAAAAMTAKDTDYIPDSKKDQIVAHTPLLGPRKSADITVKLEPGEYPFLCSFPAHFQVGMKGTITVK
jgi:azurin